MINASKYVNIKISVMANQIDENKLENMAIEDIKVYFVNNRLKSALFPCELFMILRIGLINKYMLIVAHAISKIIGVQINLLQQYMNKYKI